LSFFFFFFFFFSECCILIKLHSFFLQLNNIILIKTNIKEKIGKKRKKNEVKNGGLIKTLKDR